jgi:PAS domain S-box-containing protein
MALDGQASRETTVVDAINRIFSEALSTASIEGLARLCLREAEAVTGAAYSFMGEVNEATGRLDSLAISDRAWSVFITDDARFPAPPAGFAIKGFFDRVLNEGQSLIVNDPASHPDSQGVPSRHPALNNFLGVPLKSGERTIGMVGLGNRPGGFGAAELIAVEAMAPAVLQALTNKRGEEALRESERRLQTLIEGIPQMVWRAVDGGQVTWISPQWTAYTGQSQEEARGHGWLECVHPDDRAGGTFLWEQAVVSGRLEMDGRMRRADGVYRWFQVRATPVRDAEGHIVEWLGTSTDIDDLRRLQHGQQLLVAELQHRVRNILAVVRSVFTRTVDGGRSMEEVADHFTGRLDALARTQVMMTQSPTGYVDLEDLIRDELLSVREDDGSAISVEGPDIALPAQAAESLGLAVHELVTNAVKFGALSSPTGKVHISWRVNSHCGGARTLDLTWTEQGVPAVPVAPIRPGFGVELIEEALPYRLGAETTIEFLGGGIRCAIALPLRDGDVGAAM